MSSTNAQLLTQSLSYAPKLEFFFLGFLTASLISLFLVLYLTNSKKSKSKS